MHFTEAEEEETAFVAQISLYRKDSSNPVIALWEPEEQVNDRGR